MNIITRAQAKAQGLKRYFTGKPCKYGHVSDRHVSSLQCAECAAEKCRRQYHSDPEKARARLRSYRAENPGKVAASLRRYRDENREQRALAWKRYYEENRGELASKARQYRQENRSAILKVQRAWREKNTEARTALEARRRARKHNAMPSWFGELDDLVWLEAADLVRRRRDATGFEWAADHMVPLQSRLASGLHVASNCQVIPAYLNGWKRNKLVLTRPLEWLNLALA